MDKRRPDSERTQRAAALRNRLTYAVQLAADLALLGGPATPIVKPSSSAAAFTFEAVSKLAARAEPY